MTVVRLRTTATRPALPAAAERTAACTGVAVARKSPWPTRPTAQKGPPAADRDAAAAWLAALLPELAFVCGPPELVARQTWSGITKLPPVRMVDEGDASPYEQPLWFDPQPRLIRADSTEGPALNDLGPWRKLPCHVPSASPHRKRAALGAVGNFISITVLTDCGRHRDGGTRAIPKAVETDETTVELDVAAAAHRNAGPCAIPQNR